MFVATSTSNNVAVLRTLPEMVMSAPETSVHTRNSLSLKRLDL